MKETFTCDAKTASAELKVDGERTHGTPLHECVESALDEYFKRLDGHKAGGLFKLVITQVEEPLLRTVMRHTRGNQSLAAEILGINRTTLRNKLKLYKIQ